MNRAIDAYTSNNPTEHQAFACAIAAVVAKNATGSTLIDDMIWKAIVVSAKWGMLPDAMKLTSKAIGQMHSTIKNVVFIMWQNG